MNDAIEATGFVLLVAFTFFVWPPLVLASSGVILLLVANVREARAKKQQSVLVRFGRAFARAWHAARLEAEAARTEAR